MRSRSLTVLDAARLLGISGQRVRQLCARGQMDARKHGRDWLISRASVEARAKEASQRK